MRDSFKRINANNNFMRRSPNVTVSRTFLQWIRNCNKKILLKPLRYYNYMTFYCVINITKAPLKLNNNYKNLCITIHLSNLWSVVFLICVSGMFWWWKWKIFYGKRPFFRYRNSGITCGKSENIRNSSNLRPWINIRQIVNFTFYYTVT